MNCSHFKSSLSHSQVINRIQRTLAQDGYIVLPGIIGGKTCKRVIKKGGQG